MKIFTHAAAAALATGLAAPAALALDFGDGFYTNGEFVLEYLDGSGFSGELFGYGEVDIGYEQAGGGFGVFVGFDAFNSDNESESAIYGAISYSGDFGKLQFGVPRSALTDYIDTPDIGGSKLLDLELGALTDSIFPVFYLVGSLETPVGLRYDGTFGAVGVGVSYHNFDDGDLVNLAANYRVGQFELRGGLEHIEADSVSESSYFIGVEGEFGPIAAGLLYSNVNTITEIDSVKLYATYSPIEALDLTGTYLSLDSGGPSGNLYGFAAQYTFGPGVYVEGGYLDGDAFGDEIFNASLGVKF